MEKEDTVGLDVYLRIGFKNQIEFVEQHRRRRSTKKKIFRAFFDRVVVVCCDLQYSTVSPVALVLVVLHG